MFWKILGALGIGSVLAMAILVMIVDVRPNVTNRIGLAITTDVIIEQKRRNLLMDLLYKENELKKLEMESALQLRLEKDRILQAQRIALGCTVGC